MSHEPITLEAEYEQESEYVVTTGDIIEWRHSAEPTTPRSEPATPPSASSAEKPRYLTRRLLGRGGMGEVRLCKDFRIGRSVAMKVLHPEARLDLTAQLRFVQEAQIQGQLEHPAIPPVYDLGMQPDGTLFFTMKRLRGRTLAEILRGLREGRRALAEQFSLQRLLDAFLTVCRAIEYAHTRGIIHRDLFAPSKCRAAAIQEAAAATDTCWSAGRVAAR